MSLKLRGFVFISVVLLLYLIIHEKEKDTIELMAEQGYRKTQWQEKPQSMADEMRSVLDVLTGDGAVSPPANEEAERTVLGAMILFPECIVQIRTILSPDHFYIPRHNSICNTLFEMELANRHIDYSTVVAELSSRNLLASVGGTDYITGLNELVFSMDSAEPHARIVLEKFQLRNFLRTLKQAAATAAGGDVSPARLIDATQDAIHKLGFDRSERDFRAMSEIAGGVLDDISSRRATGHGVSGLATGLKLFDEKTGGLQKSDLIILAARPSVGKTAFALNIAVDIATGRAHHPGRSAFVPEAAQAVGIFSLEMSEVQVTQRMLSTTTHVAMYLMRTGAYSNTDFEVLTLGATELAKCPIYIDDQAGIAVSELRAKALRLQKRCQRDAEQTGMPGRNLSLIIIDYLQLMRGSSNKNQDNRQQEVSEISRSLKELARELNVPIIALSQLSRAIEARKGGNATPMLSDLRESGAIEQDADVVLFLHRNKELDNFADKSKPVSNVEEAKLIIGKQRNGPIGTVQLFFQKNIATFTVDGDKEFEQG